MSVHHTGHLKLQCFSLISLWQMFTLLSWTVMANGQINKVSSLDLLFQISVSSLGSSIQESSELI